MKVLLVLFAAGALLVSCTGDGAEETTTSIGAPTTTSTTAPTTTTSVPATTTSTPTTSTTTSATTTTLDEALAPEGSGCSPGPGDLPDGVWYGALTAYSGDAISFDLACWFTGDAATAAAAADGEESPPPNDYYVRNENDLIRDIPVGSDVPVTWYLTGDPNDAQTGSAEEWAESLEDREFWLAIWVTIEDEAVVSIEEQWVP